MAGMCLFHAWRDNRHGEEKIRYNVYISHVDGQKVTAVDEDGQTSYTCAGDADIDGFSGIADLHMQSGKIIKIVKKTGLYSGTVQKAEERTVTFDEYGEIPKDENFAVYYKDKNGSIQRGTKEQLLTGQKDVQFVAAGSKICAVIIARQQVEQIRVILNNSSYTSYDQKKAVVTADTSFTVTEKDKTVTWKKGQKVSFEPDGTSGTIRVRASAGKKIRVLSLERNGRNPEYRGTLLIMKKASALWIVNELDIEDYLCGVVPSEMPAEYEKEALKAQAIGARSYATGQIQDKRLASYGAHVDDGVSFQMYNSQKEDERSNAAVRETKGQVVTYKGEPASAYFYSCSCGSSAGTEEVWFTKNETPYLPSVNRVDGRDLSTETVFDKFIHDKTSSAGADAAAERNCGWYRWNTTAAVDSLKRSLDANLEKRCEVAPNQIQVLTEDGSYQSERVKTAGQIENIEVIKRGKSGIVMGVQIEGTKSTIRVYAEYNIRVLLGSTSFVYKKKDGSHAQGISMLPSGFFEIKKENDSYLFTGGGFGHGVGMSQDGANAMAAAGKTAADIISYYYPGVTITDREAV